MVIHWVIHILNPNHPGHCTVSSLFSCHEEGKNLHLLLLVFSSSSLSASVVCNLKKNLNVLEKTVLVNFPMYYMYHKTRNALLSTIAWKMKTAFFNLFFHKGICWISNAELKSTTTHTPPTKNLDFPHFIFHHHYLQVLLTIQNLKKSSGDCTYWLLFPRIIWE